MRPYQICINCVMDTTDSQIVFDEKGVCDHCNNFYESTLPNWHTDEQGLNELMPMVERIKRDGQGKDFDCILGMMICHKSDPTNFQSQPEKCNSFELNS